MPRQTQASKGFALFLLLFAGGILAIAGYTVLRLREEAVSNQLDIAAMHARAFEDYFTQNFNVIDLTLRHFLERPELSEQPSQLGDRLQGAIRNAPYLRSLSLLRGDGHILASSNPANLGVRVQVDDYLPPATGGAEILRFGPPWAGRDFADGRAASPQQPAAPDGRLFFPLARRVAGAEASFTLLANVNPDFFVNHLTQNIPPGLGVVELLRYDRMLILSTDRLAPPGELHPHSLAEHPAPEEEQEFGHLPHRYQDGQDTFTAFRASRHHPFLVVVHLFSAPALEKWASEARTLMGVVGMVLLVALVLATILFLRLQRAARLKAEADERLRLAAKVFDAALEGILITDRDNRILSVNPAFSRITGYSEGAAVGKNPRLLASGRHDSAFYRGMWAEIDRHGGWSGEVVNRHADGEFYTEWLSIARLPEEPGRSARYVGVFTDITARKAAEAQLRLAKEAAEAANKAKSTFLANMSHELRTPLNAVMGHAQLLERGPGLDPQQRRALQIISRSSDHLLNLITDILDLARIEAGRFELQPAPCDSARFFQALCDMAGLRAEEKAIGFRFEAMTPLPALLEIDERRMRQIGLNLLSNALKFTERGGVILRAGHADERLAVEVEDSGPGIPPGQQEAIFERFRQVGDDRYKAQGSGLGLAIVRELTTRMGGVVTLESTPGRGSCFRVEVPARIIVGAPAGAAAPPSWVAGYRRTRGAGPLRLLIADDLADNRLLLCNTLAPLGFELREAVDGADALAQTEAWHPDLILMDLRMPTLDGIEATRRLRGCATSAQIPIIALSAAAFAEDRVHALDAGCNEHLPKPVRIDALTEALARLLPIEWVRQEAAAAPSPLPQGHRKALLELIRHGNMKGVREYLDGLTEPADASATLEELRMLAKGLRIRELRERLERTD
jgi:PAS domain S-box-containing protein